MVMIRGMKNRQSGFTTMELLTTVVIAGILIAMAAPSYSRFVASSRVTEQANDLVGAMSFARSEAIRRNAPVELCRAATDAAMNCAAAAAPWRHWIVRVQKPDASVEVLRRGVLQDYGNTLSVESSLTAETIRYTPDGLASTGGALVNAGGDAGGTEDHFFLICSTRFSNENIRRLTLGASSRVTITRESDSCT